MKLRRRAVLKWTGASLCALILVAWPLSRWFRVTLAHRRSGAIREAIVEYGVLSFERMSEGPENVEIAEGLNISLRPARNFPFATYRARHQPWAPTRLSLSGFDAVQFPLYIPFALLVGPTAFLFYRDRRRVRWAGTGRCVGCGYDLSGLPPGAACPECGTAVRS